MSEPQLDHDSWFADTVEQLFAEFWQHHPLTLIVAVARQCRADVEGSGTPSTALPEVVERIARQRLRPPVARSGRHNQDGAQEDGTQE